MSFVLVLVFYLHVVLVLLFLVMTKIPVFDLSCALSVFLMHHLGSIYLLILHSVLAKLYNFPLSLLLSKFLLPGILQLHAYILLYFLLMSVRKCARLLPGFGRSIIIVSIFSFTTVSFSGTLHNPEFLHLYPFNTDFSDMTVFNFFRCICYIHFHQIPLHILHLPFDTHLLMTYAPLG